MPSYLTTRREFLGRGLALLAVAPTIPTFLDQTMMALAGPLATSRSLLPGKDERILIIVQLSGGNDGLSTVIPYADDDYRRARPTLGRDGKAVLKLNDQIGLHPNLTALKDLYDKAQLAIVQGVGYPNPNRSHFRSMDIWQSADPVNEQATTGWIGRYFDNTCRGAEAQVGISMGPALPLAMQGARITPLSFQRPEAYRYNGRDVPRYLSLNRPGSRPEAASWRPVSRSATRPHSPQSAASSLDFVCRTAMDAQLSSDQILQATRSYQPAKSYPAGEFANGLKTIAAMIGQGLPTRVYYISLGGFDTHAAQQGRHDQLMTQLAEGLASFWADMIHQRNQDRVLLMTFSEFGRRVAQNASGGTDHGTAAPMFVLGSSLRAGLLGRHPSLSDLDRGDLRFATDFRDVYATVLERWLQVPSKPILRQQFGGLPLFKT